MTNQKVHFIHSNEPPHLANQAQSQPQQQPQPQQPQQPQQTQQPQQLHWPGQPHHVHLNSHPTSNQMQQNYQHFISQPNQNQTQLMQPQPQPPHQQQQQQQKQQLAPSHIHKQVQHLFTQHQQPQRTILTGAQQNQQSHHQGVHPLQILPQNQKLHAPQGQQIFQLPPHQAQSQIQNQQSHIHQGNFIPENKFINHRIRITPVTPPGEVLLRTKQNASKDVQFFRP